MAEIKKEDIFEPGVIEAPLEMAKNMDKLLESIQGIIKAGKQSEVVLETATSTRKLAEETKTLSNTQTELDKIQKQFATSTQKLGDEYLANKRALASVNDEVKKRLELGDKEAKDITAKNASLKQLEAALLANRKAYADLSNEQDRTSKAGKELLNVIKSQDVSAKALRDSMGQAQAHVGGYKEAIEQALGSLSKLNPEMAATAEVGVSKFGLLTKLISGPFIAAFGAAFAVFKVLQNSVEEFTTTTAEGAKGAKYFMAEWHAAQEVIRDGYLAIGKAIVNVGELNRTTGEGFLSTAARFLGMFDLAEKLVVKTKEQIVLIKEQAEVRQDEIELVVKGSELELEKSKLLFEARDKLLNTDIERIEAVDKAEKVILEKEAMEKKLVNDKIDVQRAYLKSLGAEFEEKEKALDLLKNEQVLRHVTKDQIKELAELEGELNKIEQGFFDSGRRRQALRISATEDLIKKTIDSGKAISAANDKTEETILHKNINTNNRILGNQEYTIDQQLAALQDSQVQQSKLIDVAAERDKRTAAENAFARVEVDTKALRAILENTKLNALERAQAIFDERARAVHADAAYQAEVIAIDKKAEADRQEILKTGGAQAGKIILDNYQYFIDLKKALNKKDLTEELGILAEQFTSREISLTEYEAKKLQITKQAAKADIQAQVDEQTEALLILNKALQDKGVLSKEEAALLKKIQDELVESNKKNYEQDVENFKLALKAKQFLIAGYIQEFQTLVTTANNFASISSQARLADLSKESKALKDKADLDLEIAGDNQEAKDAINKKAKEDQEKLDKEIAAEKNKQAKIQRANDIIQAGVIFSKAILAALAGGPPPFNLVLAEITAAVAGIQVAAISAAPIPQYELGTKSALGGLAIVGEAGVELIREPGKDWTISPDSASMVQLAAGTEVVPHEETMRRLALASMQNEAFVDGGNFALYGKMSSVQQTIKEIGERTIKAIEGSRVDFEQHGSILYKAIKKSDGNKKLIRCKSLSS